MSKCSVYPTKPGDVRAGFTLIEVLLVLVILVILGSLATTVFTGTQDKANINAAKAQAGIISDPMNRYRLDMNKFPSKLEELWEEPSDSKLRDKWSGPYVEELKDDPWENPYQYLAEGKKNKEKYDFWSNGPDGQSGTEDDIGNWEN
ncbi:MAG: type II secretion system major pseudopilin GspG [Bythopirellula sp.]